MTSPCWLAVVGSLTLATMYWHIFTSRLGQRPILVPLVSVPIFWFLLKGWASGGKKWFILSGLCLGLAGHTYPAARLLPLILVVAVLPEFWPLLKSVSANLGPNFWNPLSYAKGREEKLKNFASLRALRGSLKTLFTTSCLQKLTAYYYWDWRRRRCICRWPGIC